MTVSRRGTLFSGAAAVVIGSGITAGAAASVADLVPANPDAELIAIGAEARPSVAQYARLQTKWWSLRCGDPGLQACATEMDIPHDRVCGLADKAVDISASTPEGWQAKAVLIRHLMTVEHNSNGTIQFETFDQELIWSLICDMTGRAPMSGARQRRPRNRDTFTSNLPCRWCSAVAAVLDLAFLVLCGPVLVQPVGAYFRQSAPVLSQAQ